MGIDLAQTHTCIEVDCAHAWHAPFTHATFRRVLFGANGETECCSLPRGSVFCECSRLCVNGSDVGAPRSLTGGQDDGMMLTLQGNLLSLLWQPVGLRESSRDGGKARTDRRAFETKVKAI